MAKTRRASAKDVAKKKVAGKPALKSVPPKVATKASVRPKAKSLPPTKAKAKPSTPPAKSAGPSAAPKAKQSVPPKKVSTPPKKVSVPPKAAVPVKSAPPRPLSAPPRLPRRAESVRPSEIPEEPPRPQAALIRSPELEMPAYVDARQRELESMAVAAHPMSQLTPKQMQELHKKLLIERGRVLAGQERHLQEALEDPGVLPDETDMAQRSTEQAYLIRFADKERKLLNEIEHALDKMKAGEYGVCEGTDEPIGFKRLELRPWTRYSVAYKEQMERDRSQHRR